jgi:hypothetical protein
MVKVDGKGSVTGGTVWSPPFFVYIYLPINDSPYITGEYLSYMELYQQEVLGGIPR